MFLLIIVRVIKPLHALLPNSTALHGKGTQDATWAKISLDGDFRSVIPVTWLIFLILSGLENSQVTRYQAF